MRRWLRRLAWLFVAVAGPVLVLLAVLRTYYHGEVLAKLVTDRYVNPNIRGRLEVRSITWENSDFLTGWGDMPVTVHDAKVYDPNGKLVVRMDRAVGTIHWWDLISPWGHHDLIVEDMLVQATPREKQTGDLPYILLEEYPARVPGVTAIGLIDAFSARFVSAGPPPKTPGWIIEVAGLTIDQVNVDIEFYDFRGQIFSGSIHESWVRNSSRVRTELDFAFFVRALRAPRAWFSLKHCYPTPDGSNAPPECYMETRVDLKRAYVPLAEIRPDDQKVIRFRAQGETVQGAEFQSVGSIDRLWIGGGDVNIVTQIQKGGELARHLLFGLVAGDDVTGEVKLTGKFRTPMYTVDIWNLEMQDMPPDLPIGIDRFYGEWESGTGDGRLREVVVSALGGKTRAAGVFGTILTPNLLIRDFHMSVGTLEPVDIARFLGPSDVVLLGGTQLSGSADVAGTPTDMTFDPLTVRVGQAQVSGRLRYVDDTFMTRGLRVLLPGAEGQLAGAIALGRRRIDMTLALTANRLRPFLERFAPDLEAYVGEGSGSVKASITGGLDAPHVRADVAAQDLPLVKRLEAHLTYVRNRLALESFSADAMGGQLSGDAVVHLGRTPRFERLHLTGGLLQLDRIPGWDTFIGGKVSFTLEGSGDAAAYEAEVELTATDLVAGELVLGDARSQLRLTHEGIVLHSLHVGRPGQTATLDMVGQVLYRGPIDLELELTGFDLGQVPALGEAETPIDGRLSVAARVRGSMAVPEVSGTARLAQVSFGDNLLGGARLSMEPWPQGRVHLRGTFFQNKLAVDGWVSALPPFDGELRVTFRRVELAEVLPAAMLAGIEGWVSGHADIKLGLAPEVTLRVDELALTVRGQDEYGRPRPILVRNRSPVVVSVSAGEVRFIQPLELYGEPDLGGLRVAGRIAPDALDLEVSGSVHFGLLDFLTRQWVEDIDGQAEVDLVVQGTPERPQIRGTLRIGRTVIRPPGVETDVVIPSGFVRLTSDRVTVENLAVEMDGQRLGLTAQIVLADFIPTRVEATLQGRVPAKMFALIDPASVSGAEGSAAVDLKVRGPIANPTFSGKLAFDSPFDLAVRGLRHDLSLQRGEILFSNRAIALKEVGGTLSDAPLDIEGDPAECDGEGFCTALRLERWEPDRVHLGLRMTSLVHRIPGILEAEITTQLVLRGSRRGLTLSGNILIVDGRFVQPFDIVQEVFIPKRVAETATPFWVGEPLLENLRLNLTVSTNGTFLVQNNLADLTLDGTVDLSGTLMRPRLDGQIAIRSGTIRIPGFRANFTLRSGTMTFYRAQKVPEETPDIFLTAESDFQDRDKQRHIITLRLSGPLGRLVPELWTDTGLNQAQTLNLLISGRSDADEVLRGRDTTKDLAREDSIGGSTTLGGSSAFGEVADPFIKEVTGAFISNIIGDPLKKITRLDCVEIEPGIDSWRFYGCKDLGRNIRLEGEVEEGFAAGRRDRAGVKYQVTDDATFEGFWQKDTPGEDQAEEVRNRLRLQFKFRFVWRK